MHISISYLEYPNDAIEKVIYVKDQDHKTSSVVFVLFASSLSFSLKKHEMIVSKIIIQYFNDNITVTFIILHVLLYLKVKNIFPKI